LRGEYRMYAGSHHTRKKAEMVSGFLKAGFLK
jgi:hypothetical protein